MPAEFWDNPPTERGKRLRDEIEATELGVQGLLKHGIISRQRLYAMMQGAIDKAPASVMIALANYGVDLSYVLTGRRKGELLTRDENALIDNYRNMNPDRQKTLQEVGTAFAQPGIDDDCEAAD